MANLKTMTAVQRAFEQGRTREQLAKQYKVSTSTIDDWRKKVTAGTTATGGVTKHRVNQVSATRARRTQVHQVRSKSDTILAQINDENLRLAAVVGKLFLALTERRNGEVSKVVL